MPVNRFGFDASRLLALLVAATWIGCSSPVTGGGVAQPGAVAAVDVTLQPGAGTDASAAPLDAAVTAADAAGPDSGGLPDGFFDPADAADDSQDGGDVAPVVNAPPWLLSIDNGTHTLRKVDIVTGKSAVICTLSVKNSYPSLTFRRDNVLVASRKGIALDQIDPCTCQVTAIGAYGAATGVNGITSDHAAGLFGISSGLEALISINPATGVATSIGPLGAKFGTNGATWSDAIHALYAINGADNMLYVVDPKTGAATPQAVLSQKFGSVGVERHPGNGQIYACSDDGMLRQVDPVTGNVTTIGPLGESAACTNLAAPWGPVSCVDNVTIP